MSPKCFARRVLDWAEACTPYLHHAQVKQILYVRKLALRFKKYSYSRSFRTHQLNQEGRTIGQENAHSIACVEIGVFHWVLSLYVLAQQYNQISRILDEGSIMCKFVSSCMFILLCVWKFGFQYPSNPGHKKIHPIRAWGNDCLWIWVLPNIFHGFDSDISRPSSNMCTVYPTPSIRQKYLHACTEKECSLWKFCSSSLGRIGFLGALALCWIVSLVNEVWLLKKCCFFAPVQEEAVLTQEASDGCPLLI